MIALNNPGNIRASETSRWQGLDTPAQERGFCRFKTPAFGVRALAILLVTAQDKHGCSTISEHIQRYAPLADGNPTDQYISNVSKWTGFPRTMRLNVHTYEHARPFVEAIIHQEQGSVPYSGAVIDEGLRLAGIVPERRQSRTAAVATDPKVIGSTIAATAASAQAIVSSVGDVWDTLGKYIEPRIIIWSCVAIVATLAVVYAYQRIKAMHEGRI